MSSRRQGSRAGRPAPRSGSAPSVGSLLPDEPCERVAIHGAIRGQGDGKAEMSACLVAAAEHLERLTEAEMAVRRRRVDLEQSLERLSGTLVLATVVVGAGKRFDDRALVGLQAIGALQKNGGLCVVAALEQSACALEEAVGRLALGELVEPLLVFRIHPPQC